MSKIAYLRQVIGQRDKVAAEIAALVGEFERDLAKALASGGKLASLLPMARIEADVSPVVGQDVITHFVSSLGHLTEAMGRTVAGHNGLAVLARVFRVEITAGGDKGEIPPWTAALPQGADPSAGEALATRD